MEIFIPDKLKVINTTINFKLELTLNHNSSLSASIGYPRRIWLTLKALNKS